MYYGEPVPGVCDDYDYEMNQEAKTRVYAYVDTHFSSRWHIQRVLKSSLYRQKGGEDEWKPSFTSFC